MNVLLLTGCSGVPQCWLRFFQVSEIQWTTWAEFCWTFTHLRFQQYHSTPIISWQKYLLHDTFHQSSLPCFCQPFIRSTYSTSSVPCFLTNLRSSWLIWKCSWTPLIPWCWLKEYRSERFKLSALSHHSPVPAPPPWPLQNPLSFFVCPSHFHGVWWPFHLTLDSYTQKPCLLRVPFSLKWRSSITRRLSGSYSDPSSFRTSA